MNGSGKTEVEIRIEYEKYEKKMGQTKKNLKRSNKELINIRFYLGERSQQDEAEASAPEAYNSLGFT